MAKFKVLRAIELDGALYLPEGSPVPSARPGGVRSSGNGTKVKVDTSGMIDLTAAQAAEMTAGQIAAMPPIAPPKPESKKSKK